MIVATAGHVDHGKTLLVRVLTGVDTDRLPDEKARGISIDVGFAYVPLADDGLIGFVDVPGHERFVHNMLAGVCGIDFALLVVAADDGVMPQTREHLQILDLLGIRRGIAVVTKTDRVADERVVEVAAELRGMLDATTLADSAVLPVSAVSGDGVQRLRDALHRAARVPALRRVEGQYFRLAVDRAFSVAGSGTVVTGAVFGGEVRPGDRLLVSPSGATVRVRALQIRGESAPRAQAGERCALNLSGIERGGVARGDWVLHKALHAPTRRLDVRVTVLASETAPLSHWTPVHLHLATADVMTRVAIARGGTIAPGTSSRAQLVCERPLAALAGDRFILRDPSAARTLGGGVVVSPFGVPLRGPAIERRAVLAALELGDAEAALEAILKLPTHAVDCAALELTFNLAPARAAALYRDAGAVLLGRERRFAVAKGRVEALRAASLALLREFHRVSPQCAGIDAETLRLNVAPWLTADAFAALVRPLIEARALEHSGAVLRLPGHDPTANQADRELWYVVLPALLAGHFSPPTVAELAGALRIDENAMRGLLHRKAAVGDVLRVTEERFYPKATLAILAANAALVARSASRGLFTAAQYRDAIGVGRTLAIRILECFDTLGITQRIGDARKMHKNFVPLLGPAKPALAPRPLQPGAVSLRGSRRRARRA